MAESPVTTVIYAWFSGIFFTASLRSASFWKIIVKLLITLQIEIHFNLRKTDELMIFLLVEHAKAQQVAEYASFPIAPGLKSGMHALERQ